MSTVGCSVEHRWLWATGHFVEAETPTHSQLADPLLRLWVANGRRWP